VDDFHDDSFLEAQLPSNAWRGVQISSLEKTASQMNAVSEACLLQSALAAMHRRANKKYIPEGCILI
jgi:hypothetical protein